MPLAAARPPFNAAAARDRIKRKIEAVQTLDDLGEVWRAENPVIKEVGAVSKPMMAELVAAKNARRDALTPKPADWPGGSGWGAASVRRAARPSGGRAMAMDT